MKPENVLEKLEAEFESELGQVERHNDSRFYVEASSDSIVDLAAFFHEDLEARMSTITGRDTERGIELLYHFAFDTNGGYFITIRLRLDRENPVVDSIHEVIPGASSVEREIHDFLGVEVRNIKSAENFMKFEGLPEDHYPLRQGVEAPPDE